MGGPEKRAPRNICCAARECLTTCDGQSSTGLFFPSKTMPDRDIIAGYGAAPQLRTQSPPVTWAVTFGASKAAPLSPKFLIFMVPGGGFEPPTRGFSIRCSTLSYPAYKPRGPDMGCLIGHRPSSVQRKIPRMPGIRSTVPAGAPAVSGDSHRLADQAAPEPRQPVVEAPAQVSPGPRAAGCHSKIAVDAVSRHDQQRHFEPPPPLISRQRVRRPMSSPRKRASASTCARAATSRRPRLAPVRPGDRCRAPHRRQAPVAKR